MLNSVQFELTLNADLGLLVEYNMFNVYVPSKIICAAAAAIKMIVSILENLSFFFSFEL